jgi:predicted dithiol-disulfide oxidoreductase (DUF899 family)
MYEHYDQGAWEFDAVASSASTFRADMVLDSTDGVHLSYVYEEQPGVDVLMYSYLE